MTTTSVSSGLKQLMPRRNPDCVADSLSLGIRLRQRRSSILCWDESRESGLIFPFGFGIPRERASIWANPWSPRRSELYLARSIPVAVVFPTRAL